ncbi:OPA3-domain-containing protein [Mycena indigotica]|uniref:OPA3-domain-containing protein n=1 Tax=Mycena indigotica TaxID=2126181 RepID=A0A8H6S0X4_9AGAR|nr:OPA3-domain-containing protein [Mycena indigotica]KAF7289270.1 OPA3-domain-containing protein [Mycena indigotica]
MATAKIATLIIRTIAKPISAQIKHQATQHERFRHVCINLAQLMYRSEVRLRTNILGEPAKHIRPLSETKAIENGANALAEGFLFSVAAVLILGETYRSSRSQSKRRDVVDDHIEDLAAKVGELTTKVNSLTETFEERLREIETRDEHLRRAMGRIIDIGLRGGWAEFEGTPLQLPRVGLVPPQKDGPPLDDEKSDA